MEIILNNIKYQINDNGFETYVVANNYKGDVIIPPYIQHERKRIAVKGIAFGAFKECRELTSVLLPEGLSTIESRAFQECTQLKEINIPDSVTEISGFAFGGCSSLKQITLSN